ncbi:hypothetical protein ACETU7_04220 [Rhodococcus sp. 3Y1]
MNATERLAVVAENDHPTEDQLGSLDAQLGTATNLGIRITEVPGELTME